MAVLNYAQTGQTVGDDVTVYRVLTPAAELPSPFLGVREVGHVPTARLSQWARDLTASLSGLSAGLEAHVRLANGYLEFVLLSNGESQTGFVAP